MTNNTTTLSITATSEPQQWFAAYTRPHFEREVEKQLNEIGIYTYLPLVKKLHQWSDRKKWVEMPLFNSYVFVKTNLSNRYKAVGTRGFVRFVSFEGKPVPLRQSEIDLIKRTIARHEDVIVTEKCFKTGNKVEIISGFLKGKQGEFIEFRGKKRVALVLDSLGMYMLITIPFNKLKILQG